MQADADTSAGVSPLTLVPPGLCCFIAYVWNHHLPHTVFPFPLKV